MCISKSCLTIIASDDVESSLHDVIIMCCRSLLTQTCHPHISGGEGGEEGGVNEVQKKMYAKKKNSEETSILPQPYGLDLHLQHCNA